MDGTDEKCVQNFVWDNYYAALFLGCARSVSGRKNGVRDVGWNWGGGGAVTNTVMTLAIPWTKVTAILF
jgi:hypothetical protein